jgi:putative heme iron utilization protein
MTRVLLLAAILIFHRTFDCNGFSMRPSSVAFRSPIPSLAASVAAVNGDTSASPVNEGEHQNSSRSSNAQCPNIRLNVNEKARTVTSVCTSGTLCTVSSHEGIQGAPFGSFVDYVLDDEGNPVLLMNEMSMHTINIQQASAADSGPALVTLFTQLGGTSSSPISSSSLVPGADINKGLQDVSRCSVTGTLEKIIPSANVEEMNAIRMRYSLTHTYADQVMDSPKFAFYRLTPLKIYFVGGFGVLAKWVDPQDYRAAAPDILARQASEIVARINRDHADDLVLTATHLLQVTGSLEKIRVTSVDRLGMDIRVTVQVGTRRNKLKTDEYRIGFRIPVISVEDAKSEILKVFQEAWEKGNNVSWSGDDEVPGSTVPIMKIAADSLE